LGDVPGAVLLSIIYPHSLIKIGPGSASFASKYGIQWMFQNLTSQRMMGLAPVVYQRKLEEAGGVSKPENRN